MHVCKAYQAPPGGAPKEKPGSCHSFPPIGQPRCANNPHRPLRSDHKPVHRVEAATCLGPLGHAVAGLTSSNARCATAAVAGSPSPATCTVGNANLMPFSSNAFLIIA